MEINTVCAVSDKQIRIQFDSDFNLQYVDPDSDPMICIPKVNLVKISEPSIVDIF